MTARLIQLALACGLALPAAAEADIYRCVSPQGSTSYSDSPCPGSATMSANVTELIGACTSPECQARREQARATAAARLQEEKAMVRQMQEHRLKAEALDLDRRVQLETLRQLSALDSAQRDVSSDLYYPGYAVFPAYGYGFGRGFDRPGCKGMRCGRFPGPRPSGRHPRSYRGEPSVSVINPR
ncbi:MAG TPA: DUF4124 domain-containing protein [Burkholderiales bacterium]|jgi:hypothetical protein